MFLTRKFSKRAQNKYILCTSMWTVLPINNRSSSSANALMLFTLRNLSNLELFPFLLFSTNAIPCSPAKRYAISFVFEVEVGHWNHCKLRDVQHTVYAAEKGSGLPLSSLITPVDTSNPVKRHQFPKGLRVVIELGISRLDVLYGVTV